MSQQIIYQPLTTTKQNADGSQEAVCRFHGTEQCRAIHTPLGCTTCPVFKAILAQLNAFEQIYLEAEDEHGA